MKHIQHHKMAVALAIGIALVFFHPSPASASVSDAFLTLPSKTIQATESILQRLLSDFFASSPAVPTHGGNPTVPPLTNTKTSVKTLSGGSKSTATGTIVHLNPSPGYGTALLATTNDPSVVPAPSILNTAQVIALIKQYAPLQTSLPQVDVFSGAPDNADLQGINSNIQTISANVANLTNAASAVAGTAFSTSSANAWLGVQTIGIGNGGTGLSASPTYGQLLLGNSAGGYNLVSTSSLGINSGVWGQITGNIASQTDLQNILAAKLTTTNFGVPFYQFFSATTTDALAEGVTNKYFTNSRAQNAITNSATGLTYSGGNLSLAPGYAIPLSASTTNWNSFLNIPSSVITAGTGLSWSGNTLNALGGGSSQWTTAGSNIYTNAVNVGIGTSSPFSLLSVNGNAYVGGNLTATGTLSVSGIGTSTFAGVLQTGDLLTKGPIRDVRAYGAKGDGVTDDTAAIQAALNAGGHILIPYSPNPYIISDVLLIKSNTWLEVDPHAIIYEASGNNVEMIRNVNLLTTTGSIQTIDTNIEVTGGTWNNNWSGNPGLDPYGTGQFFLQSSKTSPVRGAGGTLGFFGVDNLILRDITVKDQNHFGIQVAVCSDWQASNITFIRTQATISDGIHVNGPSSRFIVDGVSGATGDDFVALNAWDWTDSSPNSTAGDITNGQISNLHLNSAVWGGVKMSVGTNAGTKNISIDDVTGTSTNGGFIFGTFPDQLVPSHTTGIGTLENINIKNVGVNVTGTQTIGGDTYGSVMFIKANVNGLNIDGVNLATSSQPDSQPWLLFRSGNTANNISVTNFSSVIDPPVSDLFEFQGTVYHFDLSNSDFSGVSGSFSGGLANSLIQTDSGSSVQYIDVNNVRLNNWAGLISQLPGAGGSSVTVANSQFNSVKDIVKASNAMNLSLTGNNTNGISSSIVNANNASSNVNVYSDGNFPFASGGGADLVKSAGTVSWNGLDLPVDSSLLTPSSGAVIKNTNSPSGPATWNGSSWVALSGSGGGGGSGTINSGTTGQFPYYASSGTTLTATSSLFISSNSYVGIGTTNPSTRLDLGSSLTTNSLFKAGTFEIQSYATNNGWLADNLYFDGSNFKYRSSGTGVLSYFSTDGYQLLTAPSGTVGNTAVTTSRLVVGNTGNVGLGGSITSATALTGASLVALSNGNVGIGTTSPASTLTVVGSACISKGPGATAPCSTTAGTITANVFNTASADLAENYQTTDASLTAGDIVAVDPNNDNSVIKASAGSTILGVVSTNPGVLLGGTEGSSTVPVALAGRVPVKVSVQNGNINRGDALTLSTSTPGVAVRAINSGDIIGVALSSASSDGLVTVFVQSHLNDEALQIDVADYTADENSLSTAFSNLINGVVQWSESRFTAIDGFFKHLFADQIVTRNLCVADASGTMTCLTKTDLDALILSAHQSIGTTINGTLDVTTTTTRIDSTTTSSSSATTTTTATSTDASQPEMAASTTDDVSNTPPDPTSVTATSS